MATEREYLAQQTRGATEAECPIQGCDYTGSPDSVEAHISGKGTGEHQGRYGREFRDKIRSSSTSNGDAARSWATSPSGSAEAEKSDQQGSDSSGTTSYNAGVALVVATVLVILFVLVTETDVLGSAEGGAPGEEDVAVEDESAGGLAQA